MVKHILADGTELDSIEGRVIPPTGKTEVVYRLVANFLVNRKSSTVTEKMQENQK